MIGPAGTGNPTPSSQRSKEDIGPHFTAAELVETLYRGLADNSVGRLIDTLLRNDAVLVDELGLAALDDTGAPAAVRFVAAAYETQVARDRLAGRSNPGAGSCPSTSLRSACSTGSCTTATPSSQTATPTA